MDLRSDSPAVPQRKSLPHAVPKWVRADAIFFITISCAPRSLNRLCHPDLALALFETIEFRQRRGDWFVHLILLMPDHLHALISFPRDREMQKVISNWKEIVAKKTAVRWQRDFFDHRLRAEESFDEKAHYIRINPVRKGPTPDPHSWPYKWTAL